MAEIRIEGSFELLTQTEWDKYLGVSLFDEMRIDMSRLGGQESFPRFPHPKLTEMIKEHNNKVGSLIITYALCRHYFDKGIPDDPWYISPGNEGQSIQYMPLFKNEHWMRRYWFNFFSDTFYLKISSVWDSIIEILNHFYGLDYPSDLRLRSQVLKWLKQNSRDIVSVFNEIMSDQRYIDAQAYRILAAHGTSPSTVTDTIQSHRDEWVEIVDIDSDGTLRLDENNRPIMKRVKAKTVVSFAVGEYTNVATIMKNMEDYSSFSGQKIQELVTLMAKEN